MPGPERGQFLALVILGEEGKEKSLMQILPNISPLPITLHLSGSLCLSQPSVLIDATIFYYVSSYFFETSLPLSILFLFQMTDFPQHFKNSHCIR